MLTLDRISSIEATRAVQPYTSVMYGVAPSAAPVRAEVKASEEDTQATQTKLQAQQQATAAGGTQDTGQDDTDDQLTTLTRMLGDGTLLVQQLQNGHIISSQQIKVAEYSQNGSVDTVTQASRNLRELRGTALRHAGVNKMRHTDKTRDCCGAAAPSSYGIKDIDINEDYAVIPQFLLHEIAAIPYFLSQIAKVANCE